MRVHCLCLDGLKRERGILPLCGCRCNTWIYLLPARAVAARGWNVRGYAGIGVGFKTTCKDSAAGALLDACDGVKDTEWTVPFGLLFGKWTDSGKFFGIDTRFSFGLSNVFDNLSVKNRSLQLRAIIGTKVGR